ncbi:tetratricopeptide repeat-containing sensor histidine kinase [Pleionea sediminis]|uniref:tetratricopeptide repeat-containing sensor histidine kinase n=1 Tax=Pleionea sediminis TaxID=2569479 RepID=UPI0011865188|nr:histidine kinase [Pleionea sediminis]
MTSSIFTAFLFIILTSFTSDVITPEQFEQHIEDLHKRTETSQFSVELDNIINELEEKGDTKLLTVAMSYKLREMHNHGQFEGIENKIVQFIDFAEKFNLKKVEQRLTRTYLQYADMHHNHELARKLRNKLLNSIETLSDRRSIAAVYHSVGQSLTKYEINDRGLLYLNKALKIFEEEQYIRGIIVTLIPIAELFGHQKNYEKSIHYFKQALKHAESEDDQFLISVLLFNIGNQYQNQGNPNEAKGYIEKSIEISERIQDKSGIAWSSRTLGDIYREQNEFSKSISYLSKAHHLFKELKENKNSAFSALSLVEIYLERNELEKAEKLLEHVFVEIEGLVNDKYTIRAYEMLYEFRKKKGDTAGALAAHEAYLTRLKERHAKEKEQSIERLMVLFDTERKEIENQLLKQENEISRLELDDQKRKLTIWILSFLFVLTSGLVIIAGLVRQTKMKKKLKGMAFLVVNLAIVFPICLFFFPAITDVLPFEGANVILLPAFIFLLQMALYLTLMQIMKQQEIVFETTLNSKQIELNALRSQSNPHFLFNTLNLIVSEISKRPENAKENIYNLSDLLRATVNLSKRNFSSLKEEMETALYYLKIQVNRFSERLSFNVVLPKECENLLVPSLLVLPLVENTIKHAVAPYSKKAHVEIVVKRYFSDDFKKEMIEILIRDSGPKIDVEEIKSGEGTRILSETMRLLYPKQYEISFDSTEAGGELIIRFPAVLPRS